MKAKDIVVLQDVAGDLNDGKAFYDQIEPGVGNYFWDSLLTDIESLVIYAGIHERKHGLHRMLARRFPYAIYYEVANEIVDVIAVLPMRRNPAWVKKKLEGRS